MEAQAYGVLVEVIRLIRQGKPLAEALRGSSVLCADKLTAEDIAAIRTSVEAPTRLASLYGVTWQAIRNVRKGPWY